jgi:signal transduction histidine kinase
MAEKPTYEELEQMIHELEHAESERKRVEQTLHYKTALLEAQLNSSIDGIIVVDAKGKKVLQNQKTIELWKIPQHIADNDDDKVQVHHVMQMTKNPEQFVEKITYLYRHPDETSRDEVELKDGTIFDRYSAPVVGNDGQNFGRIWTFRDITDRKRAEVERENLIADLQGALKEIRTLKGIIPICSHCKKIRDDKGYWNQIEAYIQDHSEAEFSHGICQECAKKLYPDINPYDKE